MVRVSSVVRLEGGTQTAPQREEKNGVLRSTNIRCKPKQSIDSRLNKIRGQRRLRTCSSVSEAVRTDTCRIAETTLATKKPGAAPLRTQCSVPIDLLGSMQGMGEEQEVVVATTTCE